MNIYSIYGHRVVCSTFNAGYEFDKQVAEKYLELGKTYTIDYTVVHNSSTEVYLLEIPNISFNSVFFEDLVEQSNEDDRSHPDFKRYNR
jgi:hypothetical protein